MDVKNLKNPNKSYAIEDSVFYLLRGYGKLEKILNIKLVDLHKLLQKNTYVVFDKNGRTIQAPHGELKRIHKRISFLLSRIKPPRYLMSKKGVSYIDNAELHRERKKTVKTDIAKFFPSTTFTLIYRCFLDVFKCAKDIANLLAQICCFEKNNLPTGSSLSGYIAFFSAKNMFDEIESLAISSGVNFTVYVDDITITGDSADWHLLHKVRQIIKKHGYSTVNKKSKIYQKDDIKTVTGAVVDNSKPERSTKLLIPNKRHKKIWEVNKQLNEASNPIEKQRLENKLAGMKRAANELLLRN